MTVPPFPRPSKPVIHCSHFPHRYFANEPFADFHRVEGVRGVYIATLINGSFSEENMRSVITFDKGGTWELLQPPAQTHYGEQIDCEVEWGGRGREKTPAKEPVRAILLRGSPSSPFQMERARLGGTSTRTSSRWSVNAAAFCFSSFLRAALSTWPSA